MKELTYFFAAEPQVVLAVATGGAELVVHTAGPALADDSAVCRFCYSDRSRMADNLSGAADNYCAVQEKAEQAGYEPAAGIADRCFPGYAVENTPEQSSGRSDCL